MTETRLHLSSVVVLHILVVKYLIPWDFLIIYLLFVFCRTKQFLLFRRSAFYGGRSENFSGQIQVLGLGSCLLSLYLVEGILHTNLLSILRGLSSKTHKVIATYLLHKYAINISRMRFKKTTNFLVTTCSVTDMTIFPLSVMVCKC